MDDAGSLREAADASFKQVFSFNKRKEEERE